MGFFENLGRKVEEFKQTAAETAAEEASYGCQSCGERFYTEHDDCPECGGVVVERVDQSATPDEPDGTESNDSDGEPNNSDG